MRWERWVGLPLLDSEMEGDHERLDGPSLRGPSPSTKSSVDLSTTRGRTPLPPEKPHARCRLWAPQPLEDPGDRGTLRVELEGLLVVHDG